MLGKGVTIGVFITGIIAGMIILSITSESSSQNIQPKTTEPYIPSAQTQSSGKSTTPTSTSLTSIPSQNCSGEAGCYTGKVTGIVDGDTIKVDGQSVRLALASTPELNTAMGQAAKQYVLELCPVGSKVTVDEDDGQTQGSYGRTVGLVYCNGVNVNKAILDKGFGHLSFEYCDVSEFASDSWAQNSGCSSYAATEYYQPTKSYQTTPSYQTQGSNCNPNYSGTCIPVGSPDLDCSDFSGPVTVVGSDPHRLDRDGDGIGCE